MTHKKELQEEPPWNCQLENRGGGGGGGGGGGDLNQVLLMQNITLNSDAALN